MTAPASYGWWIVNGGAKDIKDKAQQTDPVVKWARQVLTDARASNPDEATEQGLGMIYGWAWAQVLQIAGQLDGGLTRANLVLATRSIDMNNPLPLPGMTFRMDGNKDAYLTEGGIYQQFDVAPADVGQQGQGDQPRRQVEELQVRPVPGRLHPVLSRLY